MPTISYDLAKERAINTQGSGGLRPTLIDATAAARGLSNAPQLNANAAMIDFQGVQPPRVGLPDKWVAGTAAAGELMNVWTTAAMEYQDREDTLTAQAVVSQVQQAYRTLLTGTIDTPGFLNRPLYTDSSLESLEQGKAAFHNIQGQLDEATGLILNSQTANVRAKAANQVFTARQNAIDDIIQHKLKEDERLKAQTYIDTIAEASSSLGHSFLPTVSDADIASVLRQDSDSVNALNRISHAFKNYIVPYIDRAAEFHAWGDKKSTPSSKVLSSVFRSMGYSMDPKMEKLSTILYTTFHELIEDPGEKQQVIAALTTIRERQKFERDMAQHNWIVENTPNIQSAILGPSVNLAEVQQLYNNALRQGPEAQKAVSAALTARENIARTPTAESVALADEASMNNWSPAQYFHKANESGVPVLESELTRREVEFNTEFRRFDDEMRASLANKAEGILNSVELSALDKKLMSLTSTVNTDAKFKQAVLDTYNNRARVVRGDFVSKPGFTFSDYQQTMRDTADKILNSNALRQMLDSMYNTAPNIPPAKDIMQQSDMVGIRNTDNLFVAFRSLENFMTPAYIPDPELLKRVQSMVAFAKDERAEAAYAKMLQGDATRKSKVYEAFEIFDAAIKSIQQTYIRGVLGTDEVEIDAVTRMFSEYTPYYQYKFGLLTPLVNKLSSAPENLPEQ